jgi:hypothetical protein
MNKKLLDRADRKLDVHVCQGIQDRDLCLCFDLSVYISLSPFAAILVSAVFL